MQNVLPRSNVFFGYGARYIEKKKKMQEEKDIPNKINEKMS